MTRFPLPNSATGDQAALQLHPDVSRMTCIAVTRSGPPSAFFKAKEFGASTPFLYFSESWRRESLREAVKKGRFGFFGPVPVRCLSEVTLAVPTNRNLRRLQADWSERGRSKSSVFEFTVFNQIRLRMKTRGLCQQSKGEIDGAVLRSESCCLTLVHNVSRHRTDCLIWEVREEFKVG